MINKPDGQVANGGSAIKGFDTIDFIGVHLALKNINSDILNSGFYL